MKTKLLIVFAFCTFNLFSQTNLVPNYGFETWINSTTPSNWTVKNNVTQNTSFFTEGSKSAQLSIASTALSPEILAQVPMTAGTTYTVKFKYKYVSANYSGQHPISLNISKTGSATSISSSTFATDNNWTVKETTFTPDQSLSYDLSISLFTFDATAFNVLIDDVQVYILGTEQYTLIPDLNFEKKLIALGIDSGATDGKVLTNSVNKLTSLNVSNSSINDLTGIQDFVALQSLDCQKNNLTTLDVSKNVDLIGINCSTNKLTNFINTSNLSLTHLYCSSNQLTSLDVTKYIALTNLSFSSNKITSIDVLSNNLLIKLWCNSNLLTELNISNNPSLIELNCGTNQLTQLNVSRNTALTNLYCHYNQITNLDVSQNSKLEWFMCHFNQLTSIDVSNNPKLELFDCLNNKITSLDISKNPLVNELACENNQLTYLNLKNGANTILDMTYSNFVNNPNLKCIQVDDVAYSNTNWLAKKDNTATFNTDCTPYTLIPDANFEDKLIALEIDKDGKNGKVVTASINQVIFLDVADSNITDLTGLQDFAALIYFFCDRNKITTVDFSKNLMLENIGVLDNNLTSLDVSKNTKIHTLEFSKNQITSVDLSQNTNLKRLGFENNKLTKIDLTNNKELWFVSGYGNQLSSLDLSQNKKIEVVNVDNNQLTVVNVQNGNNKNFALPPVTSKTTTNIYCSFANNNKLGCIKVDDEAYSNANWNKIKDVTATYSSTCSKLGIEDSVFDKIAIYPNPTKRELHIDNIVLEKATVYDALGKLVKTTTFTSGANDNTMHLEGFPSGVYYIYLESEGANTAKKIIVE